MVEDESEKVLRAVHVSLRRNSEEKRTVKGGEALKKESQVSVILICENNS